MKSYDIFKLKNALVNSKVRRWQSTLFAVLLNLPRCNLRTDTFFRLCVLLLTLYKEGKNAVGYSVEFHSMRKNWSLCVFKVPFVCCNRLRARHYTNGYVFVSLKGPSFIGKYVSTFGNVEQYWNIMRTHYTWKRIVYSLEINRMDNWKPFICKITFTKLLQRATMGTPWDDGTG